MGPGVLFFSPAPSWGPPRPTKLAPVKRDRNFLLVDHPVRTGLSLHPPTAGQNMRHFFFALVSGGDAKGGRGEAEDTQSWGPESLHSPPLLLSTGALDPKKGGLQGSPVSTLRQNCKGARLFYL